MPPIIREIEQAAIGCWMLVRGSDAGGQRFNLSIDGFWRSFRWAFVLAVFDALDVLSGHLQAPPVESGASSGSVIWLLLVSTIASLLTFFVFPMIVGALAKPMALTKRYSTYIIVRNWLTVFLSLPIYLIDGLSGLDVLPDGLRDPLIIVLVLLTLFAGTTIARLLLGTSRSLAFGFVLLDFLLALLIGEGASRLIS